MPVGSDTQFGKHYKCTGARELCPERHVTEMASLAGGFIICLLHSTKHATSDGTEHAATEMGARGAWPQLVDLTDPVVTAMLSTNASEVPWPCLGQHEGWWPASSPSVHFRARGVRSCNSPDHTVSSEKHDVLSMQSVPCSTRRDTTFKKSRKISGEETAQGLIPQKYTQMNVMGWNWKKMQSPWLGGFHKKSDKKTFSKTPYKLMAAVLVWSTLMWKS